MNAQDLLLDSLDTRWDKYKAELNTCHSKFSEEAVHDFRVAGRRLLALLDLLRAVVRTAKIKRIRRLLKDQLDNLDELRDTQVMLADISGNIRQVPSLQLFQEYLQHREGRLMRSARKKIESLKTALLSTRIRKLAKTIMDTPQTDLDSGLFPAVDKAYAEVIQRYGRIDPLRPVTIHRLRIAFKKFRYMAESIHPILEDFPSGYLKRMRDYQTSMGNIQDMEAALQKLAKFEKHTPDGYDPIPVHSYYEERHALAISRYIEVRDKVLTFWRPAPDQPFPKET